MIATATQLTLPDPLNDDTQVVCVEEVPVSPETPVRRTLSETSVGTKRALVQGLPDKTLDMQEMAAPPTPASTAITVGGSRESLSPAGTSDRLSVVVGAVPVGPEQPHDLEKRLQKTYDAAADAPTEAVNMRSLSVSISLSRSLSFSCFLPL